MSGYMNRVLRHEGLQEIMAWAKEDLSPVIDTLPTTARVAIVGRGVSGTLAVSLVALAIGGHPIIIRKGENTHGHPQLAADQWQPTHWIFVDDCVDTGETFNRCKEVMNEHFPTAEFLGIWLYMQRGMNLNYEYKMGVPAHQIFSNRKEQNSER